MEDDIQDLQRLKTHIEDLRRRMADIGRKVNAKIDMARGEIFSLD